MVSHWLRKLCTYINNRKHEDINNLYKLNYVHIYIEVKKPKIVSYKHA